MTGLLVKSETLNANDKKFLCRLEQLDLEPIVFKLVEDPDSGVPWELVQADRTAIAYKRYLFLYYKYGKGVNGKNVAPDKPTDWFWHQHQLDSEKYREDCEFLFATLPQKVLAKFLRRVFGPLGLTISAGFVEHFPYFGMRGEQDAQNLENAFQDSLNLLGCHFEEEAVLEVTSSV